VFHPHLTELIHEIKQTLEATEEPAAQTVVEADKALAISLVTELCTALETKNIKKTDAVLDELEKLRLDAATSTAITAISDQILLGEYDAAIMHIKELCVEVERV
jgi:hypothetical protein